MPSNSVATNALTLPNEQSGGSTTEPRPWDQTVIEPLELAEWNLWRANGQHH